MRDGCSLQFYLAMHPEIERVRLVWLWPFRSVSYTSGVYVTGSMELDSVVQISEGWVYDTEYTFIGSSEDAIKYLDEYDCWDDLDEQGIRSAPVVNGELRITEMADDARVFNGDEYDDELPDQDIIESMRTFIVPSDYLDDLKDQSRFYEICYQLGADLSTEGF